MKTTETQNQEAKMTATTKTSEIEEMKKLFNAAASMVVTGRGGLKSIVTAKAKKLGQTKIDMMATVSALVDDYRASSVYRGDVSDGFALFLNLEIDKIN